MQWRVLITLADSDVSNRLTGEVMIDAEEDAAAIAEFTLLPEPGPIDADRWIGAAVIIEAVVDEAPPERLFTGSVDVPKYDIQSGLTRFRCTDGLQKRFEEMTREQIDNVIFEYWSPYIFDDSADGWEYAQDQRSVGYFSVDADRFGNIDYYSLEGGQSPALVFDDGDYIAGSLAVDLPSHRDLVNQVDLTVECRYTVYAEATAGVGWAWPYKPGDAPGWPVPSPAAAQSAAGSVGYLKSFTYQEFPATGLFEIGSWTPASSVDISSGSFISWQNERPSETCFSFSGTAAKRAAVDVTWTSHHRFRFEESITRYGVCKKQEVFSLDLSAPPPAGWEQFEAEVQSANNGQDRWPYIIPDLPVSFDVDLFSEVVWALAYMHLADVLKRHRARVHFDVPFCPRIDRRMFVRLDSRAVTAAGKVYRYVHRLDTASGRAVTSITLAPNMCGASDWSDVYDWWEEYPEPLPVPSSDFSASVSFESRDPVQSGSVGFQVDVDPPDFSPFEFVYSDPANVDLADADDIRHGTFEAVPDELVIHGRLA